MAPRRPSALDNPPSSDSDSEDISDSHLPDNPSDSEAQSSDKEERESSDNNDDDVSPSASDFTVKPSLSLPKLPAAVAASVADVADAAIKKGKSPIVRIWTYEAELAALKAMHDYISNKGLDPFADFGAFYEFAKKFIPGEMTRIQVKDKLRRLKEKYFKIANKGQQPLFSKPLEAKSFEISKKIWGRGAVAPESSAKRKGKGVEDHSVAEEKSNKRAKKEKPIVVENGVVGEGSNVNQVGFWEKYPRLKEAIDMENNGIFVKEGKRAMELDLTKMGDAEAKQLEDKWKLYQVKEAELRLFRSELVTKQTRVVLSELMKRSN